MGIAYWVDVTDFDNIRLEYEKTRPVVAVIVVDNYEELLKNQPDRVISDLRDAVEEKLSVWCADNNGLLKRYARDRYLFVFEEQHLERMIEDKFSILEDIHKVVSPSGIHALRPSGIRLHRAGRRCGHRPVPGRVL